MGELPPLVPIALKITACPAHTGLTEAEILTPTVKKEVTVIVITLLEAGLFVVQAVFETQVRVGVTFA